MRSILVLSVAIGTLPLLACGGSRPSIAEESAAATTSNGTIGSPGQLDQHFITGVGNPATVQLWPLGNPGGSTCSGAELDITYVDETNYFSRAATIAAWVGLTEVSGSTTKDVTGFEVLTEPSGTSSSALQYFVPICLATGDTTAVAIAFANAAHSRWDSNESKNYGLTFDPPATVSGSCGGQTCYAGQACVSGICEFTSCTGSRVPGDYATIQDAIDALSTAGRTETICLGAETYSESVRVPQGSIALQGVSPSQTVVTSLRVTYAVGLGDVSLTAQGVRIAALSFDSGVGSGAGSATITASSLGSLSIDAGYGNLNVTLDGVDLSVIGKGAALSIAQSSGYFDLSIQNSYIHDSLYGIEYTTGSLPIASSTIALLNNTFARNTTAVSTPAGCADCPSEGTPTVQYFNNLFVDNGVAVETQLNDVITDGNNALFGNTTNYAGVAAAGPGYVTADPRFDTSTAPPGLLAGSPCRGTALASAATNHDFWGRPRGTRADIGAVQSSP